MYVGLSHVQCQLESTALDIHLQRIVYSSLDKCAWIQTRKKRDLHKKEEAEGELQELTSLAYTALCNLFVVDRNTCPSRICSWHRFLLLNIKTQRLSTKKSMIMLHPPHLSSKARN